MRRDGRVRAWAVVVLLGMAAPAAGQPAALPAAIFTDPPASQQPRARLEVLHVPSGGVAINGVAYLAAGPGPHPTLVLCHGLPGNEKNLDLAQAVRRAGWNVVTFNYRGSWGSPGSFRFAQNPEDARAVLAFIRDPAQAAKLGIDPARIAIAGHSMGGWVTALAAAEDRQLIGAALISAANMGLRGGQSRADLARAMDSNREALAGTSGEAMADELIANAAAFDFRPRAPGLARHPLLVLTSEDGLAPQADALAAAVRQAGGTVSSVHVATDHSWSDARVRLAAEVLRWLARLNP